MRNQVEEILQKATALSGVTVITMQDKSRLETAEKYKLLERWFDISGRALFDVQLVFKPPTVSSEVT